MSKTKRYHIGKCDCDLCRFYDNGYEQGKSSAIKEFERIIEEIKQEHDEDTMEDYDLSEDEKYWVCYSELKQGINRLKAKLQEKK